MTGKNTKAHSSQRCLTPHRSPQCRVHTVTPVSKSSNLPTSCFNIDGSSGHCAKWDKPVTGRQTLHEYTYNTKHLKRAKPQTQETQRWLPAAGAQGNGSLCSKEMEFHFCKIAPTQGLLPDNENTVNILKGPLRNSSDGKFHILCFLTQLENIYIILLKHYQF